MSDAPRASRPPAWRFCAIASAVFIVLVATGVNGSSIGVLYAQEQVTLATTNPWSEDPALLLGKPRAIRSDEWSIATPTAVSQTIQGFPNEPWIGLTRTDPRAFQYSLPTVDLSVVAKPQIWGYLLLGPERGLAWSWWFPFLLAAVALYLLVHLLVGRPLMAGGGGRDRQPHPVRGVVDFTFTQLAARLLMPGDVLLRAGPDGEPPGQCGLAGALWSGGLPPPRCLILYPPWTVSTGLVAAAFVVGLLVDLRPRFVSVAQIVRECRCDLSAAPHSLVPECCASLRGDQCNHLPGPASFSRRRGGVADPAERSGQPGRVDHGQRPGDPQSE